MARNSHDLGDYREVNDRLDEFFERYPEGRIDGTYEIREIPDKNDTVRPHFIYRAHAYRSAEDMVPAVGHAQEPIPGLTPYTKGSELMNAETSAWGRALVALGIKAKGESVASANEVRNRRTEDEDKPARRNRKHPTQVTPPDPITNNPEDAPGLTGAEVKQLSDELTGLKVTLDEAMVFLGSKGVEAYEDLSPNEAVEMVMHFRRKRGIAPEPVAS